MNRSIAALGALIAAPIAFGQSWEFELDNPILTPANPSTTVKLTLDPGPGAYAIAGVNFNVHASEGEWSDPTALILPSAAPPAALNPGTIIGSSVHEISLGQLWGLGFDPEPGRIDMWQATFSVTDFAVRTIDLTTETTRFRVYLDFFSLEDRVATEGKVAIRVIPAPASLAMLGLGCFAIGRRRRVARCACTGGPAPEIGKETEK